MTNRVPVISQRKEVHPMAKKRTQSATKAIEPTFAPAPAPGRHVLAALDVTDSWRTNDGRKINIAEIDDDHLWNIAGYLRRWSGYLALYEVERLAKVARPEEAAAVASSPPFDWLKTKPLWGALVMQFAVRGLVYSAADIEIELRRRDADAAAEREAGDNY
jgi:hypothetical protein